MFGISSTEFVVILFVALLVVGPQQLPQVLRVCGRAYRKLNRFAKNVSQVIDDTMYDADRIAAKAEAKLNGVLAEKRDEKDEKTDGK